MAKIPIVTSQRTITPDTTAPLIRNMPDPSVVTEAFGRLAGTAADASGALAHQLIQIKRQDRVNEVASKVNVFERELQKEFIDYVSQPGEKAYGGQERLIKFSNDTFVKLSQNIKDDAVRAELGRQIDSITTNRLDDYARHEVRQRRVVSQNTRESLRDTLKTNSFHGNGTIDENVQKYSELLTAQVGTNQISQSEAEQELLAAQREIAERQLAGVISRDPNSAVEIMKSGLFDKYLDTKSIEHYRQVAERERINQEKLVQAAEKDRIIQLVNSANKDMTDAMLNGDIQAFKEMLGKYRPTLPDSDYNKWAKEYQNMVDNSLKGVGSMNNNPELTNLQVQALTGENLDTPEDLQDFRRKVAQAVSERKIEPAEARRIVNDSEQFRQNADVQAQLRESVQTIEALHKQEMFGKGTEGELQREKTIRDLYRWTRQNPGKSPSEYTQTIFEPMVVNRLFGLLGKKVVPPKTEEIIRRREEVLKTKPQEITTAEDYLKSLRGTGRK